MIAPGIVFRVDANTNSGFGHLSRCINIARHFLVATGHPHSSLLFVGNFNKFARSLLSSHTFQFTSTRTAGELSQALVKESKNRSAVLIDSYLVNQKMLDEYCHLFRSTIIVDDTCELQYSQVDLLINFRFSAEDLFAPDAATTALGTNYYVTRPELSSLRESNTTVKTDIKSVLIFMGGGYDNIEAVQRIVDTSRKINPRLRISCVSSQPSIKAIDDVAHFTPRPDVESFLGDCDVCINGGGLIKYECIYSRIPTASLSTTELQYQDTILLANAGLIQDLGTDKEVQSSILPQRLDDILNNFELRESMMNASSALFDSQSAENLVNKIEAVL